MNEHHLLVVLVMIPALGVASQWIAWRVRVPAIILLLLTGAIAGPVTGFIVPSRDLGPLLGPLVKLAVAVILFEGGMSLRLHELKEAGAGVRRLVFLGVPVAFVLGSLTCRLVGGLSWPTALVFGAIIVVTGPTVIMPLLRHARLRRRTASYLKWEGIVNDPIGALLAVLVYEVLTAGNGSVPALEIARSLGVTIAMAGALGLGGGFVLGRSFRRGWIPEYLKAPTLLGSALLVYLAAETVQHEAGLAATTVLGLVLGNQRLASMEEIRRFKEYMVVLLVSAVFVLLTANLDPAGLAKLSPRLIITLLVLMFVIRPATVFLATMGADIDPKDRLLVAWIAPRGVVAAAVAATFADGLIAKGYGGADILVPLMFAFIALTVVAHGLTIKWLARRFGLAAANPHGVLVVGSSPFCVELCRTLMSLDVPVLLADATWHRLRKARMAGIPVHFGDVASELSEETLDLNHIGTLLAATGNDAYNALVCTAFAPEMGRDRVFQLPLSAAAEHDPKGMRTAVRGNIAFDTDAVLDVLLRRHYQGWTFRKTSLTTEFGEEERKSRHGAESMQILRMKPDGQVVFHSEAHPLVPKPGDTLVSFVPPNGQ